MAPDAPRQPGVGLFITGTDTNAGKTVATAGLLRGFRAHGLDAVAMKAVQTGCPNAAAGSLEAPDACVYRQAAGPDPEGDRDELVPYRFAPACSPHLAARLARTRIETARILQALAALRERHRVVLVEGAGGLLVPLNERETLADLLAQAGIPAVVVTPNRLGTINHTLLTLEALRRRAIPVAGLIITNCTPPDPDTEFIRRDNVAAIAAFGGTPILAEIPFVPGLAHGRAAAWESVDRALADAVRTLAAAVPDATREGDGT